MIEPELLKEISVVYACCRVFSVVFERSIYG